MGRLNDIPGTGLIYITQEAVVCFLKKKRNKYKKNKGPAILVYDEKLFHPLNSSNTLIYLFTKHT